MTFQMLNSDDMMHIKFRCDIEISRGFGVEQRRGAGVSVFADSGAVSGAVFRNWFWRLCFQGAPPLPHPTLLPTTILVSFSPALSFCLYIYIYI